MHKLYRQISGDDCFGAGQRTHDKAQDEMETFLINLGLRKETAGSIACFIATKHSYSNDEILEACKGSAHELIFHIHDFIDSTVLLPGYYGCTLTRAMCSDLFELVKQMIEPTPPVAGMMTPHGEKVPSAENFARGLKVYLRDTSSTYTMPNEIFIAPRL